MLFEGGKEGQGEAALTELTDATLLLSHCCDHHTHAKKKAENEVDIAGMNLRDPSLAAVTPAGQSMHVRHVAGHS